MKSQFIEPQEVAQLMKEGAVLLDIRSAGEYTRKHISGAQLSDNVTPSKDTCVIYCCTSGIRTKSQAGYLKKCAEECKEIYFLNGGINAWEKAGLPIEQDPRQPIDLMRQVQIAAGFLVLSGVLLGWFVAPLFYLLSGFVGAGLIFAGISGFCGMAKLLMLMPWNRVSDTN